jgi:hypothetical protein
MATKKPKKAAAGSPEDPTDHGTLGGLAAKDKAAEEADAAEVDKSIVGKIRKSGLHFVRNHVTGQDYVGIPPNNDPNASEAEKRLSAVTALDSVSPRTGMIVKPASGDSFSVGEGWGPESKPEDWAAILRPDGSPLFA